MPALRRPSSGGGPIWPKIFPSILAISSGGPLILIRYRERPLGEAEERGEGEDEGEAYVARSSTGGPPVRGPSVLGLKLPVVKVNRPPTT